MKNTERVIYSLAVVGSLVALNVLGTTCVHRIDMTANSDYTLSNPTQSRLRTLEDAVTIDAYFSQGVSAEVAAKARYVADFLNDCFLTSKGKLRYSFVDPSQAESLDDKEKKEQTQQTVFGEVRQATQIEQELMQLGIARTEDTKREGDKTVQQAVYAGIAMHYRDRTEVIPFVAKVEQLEYDFLLTLDRLIDESKRKAVLLTPDDSWIPSQKMQQLTQGLQKEYEFVDQDASINAALADDVALLVVFSGAKPYSVDAQKSIESFIDTGRSVAFLLDTVEVELPQFQHQERNHGLASMLKTYGIEVGDTLVLDANGASLNMGRRLVKYPLISIAKMGGGSVTQNIPAALLPFSTEVKALESVKADVEVLASTSQQSALLKKPYQLHPMSRFEAEGEVKSHDLMLSLKGDVDRHFVDGLAAVSEGERSIQQDPNVITNARLIVAGGSSLLRDDFLGQSAPLVLNILDWMAQDDALLALRTRGLGAAPQKEGLTPRFRFVVRMIATVGIPLLIVLLGIMRLQFNRARRKTLSFKSSASDVSVSASTPSTRSTSGATA